MDILLKKISMNKKRIFEDANLKKSANARMLIEASINHNHNSCKSTELTLTRRFLDWQRETS